MPVKNTPNLADKKVDDNNDIIKSGPSEFSPWWMPTETETTSRTDCLSPNPVISFALTSPGVGCRAGPK
jgi:hypothetical protein